MVNDQANWWTPAEPEEEAVVALLESRGVEYTDLDGWHRLDQHEIALGEPQGRARIKVVPRDEMVAISRAQSSDDGDTDRLIARRRSQSGRSGESSRSRTRFRRESVTMLDE